jgi:hypothetical protein
MTDDYELTWKRESDGSWRATDDRQDPGPVYIAWRDDHAPTGRQWNLFVSLPGGPAVFPAKRGFGTLTVAKFQALHSRCYRCSRHVPFATLEETGAMSGWSCRDREQCEEAESARVAELKRITAEIRDMPWEDVSVRDTEDGPELVIQTGNHNSTVVRATEVDLLRLSYVLLAWLRTRYTDELAAITQARRYRAEGS